MQPENLKAYIESRIKELDQKLDEQEFTLRGRFNFGMKEKDYRNLPSWGAFIKGKKTLVRLIWLQAFLLALVVYAFYPESMQQPDQSWVKTLLKVLGTAISTTLFFTVWMLFLLAFEVNKVQRITKRLLYEDLLHQIAQEKTNGKSATVNPMGEAEKIS